MCDVESEEMHQKRVKSGDFRPIQPFLTSPPTAVHIQNPAFGTT
jgi:hypothetical protein